MVSPGCISSSWGSPDGAPLSQAEKGQKNYFLYKEFTNFGWSLQVAIFLRGAFQMGLPPARLEKNQKNRFLYKEFTKFGSSLQVEILLRGAFQMGIPPARLEICQFLSLKSHPFDHFSVWLGGAPSGEPHEQNCSTKYSSRTDLLYQGLPTNRFVHQPLVKLSNSAQIA